MAIDVPFKRILIAVDTSDIGAHATLVGLQLASALEAEIAFIHVIGPAVSDGAWYAVASPELAEQPDEEISQVLHILSLCRAWRNCAPRTRCSRRCCVVGELSRSLVG